MTGARRLIQRSPNWLYALLTLALAITALSYWPSLYGGYIFDDFANIVQNNAVHIHSLSWVSLRDAAMSSPSSVLHRPLAMLTFGLNWYFGGANPFGMKAVNLAIHLINGLLLFVLLRRVVRFAEGKKHPENPNTRHADLLALCITAAWLLAPINFTAVAFVVQRMESLCQVFVLAGLWGYVVSRQRMLAGDSWMFWLAALSIVLGTGIGFTAKESAVLLPVYAVILEWALFRFCIVDDRTDKRLLAMYLVLLVFPACIGMYWLSRHAIPASAWVNRPFTLAQRLMTEPRILIDYIHWSLFPNAGDLSLYHDQVNLSYGLLKPATTLVSIGCLIAAAVAALWLKRSRPLAAIGIAWFLSAHLLTATVIPLELVFEHRNYFASIGLYLLFFSFLLPGPRAIMVVARATACAGILILFATITYVRAVDWSDPLTFAVSEVRKNPDSPRTAYELGRVLVEMSKYDPKSPFVPRAYAALDHAATLPGADALPDQALLMLSSRLHRPIPRKIWSRIQQRLADQPLSAQNIAALYSLSECAISRDCAFSKPEMVDCFLAALKHKPASTRVLSIYANYAINVLHDSTLAIDLATTAVKREPQGMQLRRNLLLLLQITGHHGRAEAFYKRTLREVPGASSDSRFMHMGRTLPDQLPAAQTIPAVPKSTP